MWSIPTKCKPSKVLSWIKNFENFFIDFNRCDDRNRKKVPENWIIRLSIEEISNWIWIWTQAIDHKPKYNILTMKWIKESIDLTRNWLKLNQLEEFGGCFFFLPFSEPIIQFNSIQFSSVQLSWVELNWIQFTAKI